MATDEEAVGVADDARETSQGAGEVRTAGDAGFLYPSRSRPPLTAILNQQKAQRHRKLAHIDERISP